jgi:hypothetical protein
MKLSVSLLETDAVIRNHILNQIKDYMSAAIVKSQPTINSKIIEILKEALKEEPEYASLMNGSLRLEFGIPDVNQVNAVVNALAETTSIQQIPLKINNYGITGGFKLVAMKSDDMNGIIGSVMASVSDTERGYVLPWLEWLLLKGNEPIVRNYDVKIGPNPYSRTGMAIMIESKKNWRVPPQFAGTISNNWTTRAIDRCSKSIQQIIEKTIEDNL